MSSDTLELTKDLIARASVTPEDAGCQSLMIERLEMLGFHIERLRFDDVDNFWARRGETQPLFVFAGHTDVVPPGNEQEWDSPPFTPVVKNGLLYGRGAADMKGSLAAMITACERFIACHPNHSGSIGFLITSDEEGPAINGTQKVVEHLKQRAENIDVCLVGEPSSTQRVGDVIKNGRRGSLGGKLVIHGEQGHVAYPHLAQNPIHLFAPAAAQLCATEWDQGNEFFPPTTFQISNIHAGTGATNVIPGDLFVDFNFRFSTDVTEQVLRQRVEALLEQYKLKYTLEWNLSGQPFITKDGALIDATKLAIKEVTGIDTRLSTEGGTSDGRFIRPEGAEVVELGPCNESIHKINEHVRVADLDCLSDMYEHILQNMLT